MDEADELRKAAILIDRLLNAGVTLSWFHLLYDIPDGDDADVGPQAMAHLLDYHYLSEDYRD